jgi:hypothetical protein
MLTEVIILMSITEEHATSSWNLLAINKLSAVYGKNLPNEVGTAHTNNAPRQKLTVRLKRVITLFCKRCCDSNLFICFANFDWHVTCIADLLLHNEHGSMKFACSYIKVAY